MSRGCQYASSLDVRTFQHSPSFHYCTMILRYLRCCRCFPSCFQMRPRGQQRSVVSNPMEQRNARVPPLVNEFSGEDIIPFTDCETVRNARQSRAARILAPSTSTRRAPSSDATEPPEVRTCSCCVNAVPPLLSWHTLERHPH